MVTLNSVSATESVTPLVTTVVTQVFEQNANAWLSGKRRALNEGGTSSSKTYSILQLILLIAQHGTSPLVISVVSESLPHLKRGCIRDFTNILGDAFNPSQYHKTENRYQVGQSVIEFFPADEPSKMRGGRRDILFINEANNITYEAFRELDIRTRLFTFLDWNPVSEFWVHENRLADSEENVFIHSTYRDCLGVIPPEVVKNIESNRDKDPNWWNVYGLGLLGKIEGLVYPQFEQIDELPVGDVVYGLDFGFLVDPTVLVKNIIVGDKVFSKQMLYDTSGLTNDAIARQMDLLGVREDYDEIYADPSEPKSIEEIHQQSFNIKEAVKGPGSVEYGHQKVNQYTQYWTKDSLDCIKEQRNFRYIADKDGRYTDKTTHKWSHAMDARRYALATHLGKRIAGVRRHRLGDRR
jgi:phage terminase large subunit|tara:strand:+ start:807 stop:2036 length:1230 start_codon:yes stop_codon:yes gene_type:complete